MTSSAPLRRRSVGVQFAAENRVRDSRSRALAAMLLTPWIINRFQWLVLARASAEESKANLHSLGRRFRNRRTWEEQTHQSKGAANLLSRARIGGEIPRGAPSAKGRTIFRPSGGKSGSFCRGSGASKG
eukprot:GHVT01003405.1.p2 GENE.GHVT01003405.1~~GHVT01003405.1.p2  ORF type:complete len:129 (-),score=25.91 GHVT01003405.1:128-514(-)